MLLNIFLKKKHTAKKMEKYYYYFLTHTNKNNFEGINLK